MEKKKLYIITEQEFKEIFKLEDGYKIPKHTLKQYSLYVKGSALLYKELCDINKKKPVTINFQGKTEKIIFSSQDKEGWQSFVNPLGNRLRIECYFIDKIRKSPIPFWTYTKFGDKARSVAHMAYNQLENALICIQSKYVSKYKIQMQWRNMFNQFRDLNGPIWLDGCVFMSKLEVKNPEGIYQYIGDYNIKQTITNRYNIWNGKILDPVTKILS